MKKFIFSKPIYLVGFIFAFSIGCSDSSRYTSEKLFWKAEKEAAMIFAKGIKNSDDSDYDKLISLYKKVADGAPLEAPAAQSQFIIADLYFSQGKYDEAREQLTNIINNFSTSPSITSRAQLTIGKLYESRGKWQEALSIYEKLMEKYSLTPIALNMPIYIVRHYQDVGDSKGKEEASEKAVRHYDRLIKEYGETSIMPAVQSYLASFYITQKDFEKAIQVWDVIILNHPKTLHATRAYLAKGEVYSKALKDAPKAIRVYEEFITKYPKHRLADKAKVQLGRLYLTNSQNEKAKNIFYNLLEEYPQDKDISLKAYIGLSYCYRKEANSKEVLDIYEKIRKYYPDTKAALSMPFLIAQYYEELKYDSKANRAYKEAFSEYQRILKDDKKNEETRREAANFLALCYIKRSEVDKALGLLRGLADNNPGNPMYLLDIAALYRNLKNLDNAIDMYEELINKYPDNKSLVRLAKKQIEVLRASLSE